MRTAFMLVWFVAAAAQVQAQLTFYRDEAQYLADLAILDACVTEESFEDDAAWGAVRSTISGGTHSLPAVSNLGITWTSNHAGGEVTTSQGPARTGLWGFYAYPHGDPLNGIHDGFVATSAGPMLGFGGWLETNTFGARVNFIVDGTAVVDFNGDNLLDYAHQFFGVIDPAGLSTLEVHETEAGGDEVLFVFSDDFRVGWEVCPQVPIFEDGFESGTTSAWSATVP